MPRDRITGLLNFEEFLINASAAIADKSKRYLIIAADICDFHYINSTYGYDTGDQILKDVSDIMKFISPADNLLYSCRAHSDHFIALFVRSNESYGDVYDYITKFKNSVHRKISERISNVSPNMNVGVYFLSGEEENIISAVDKANVARRTGKGNYNVPCVIYSDRLMDLKENGAKILPIFEEAIKNNSIIVHLQPKISAETQKIVGAEALSRLLDTNGQIIPPNVFINALEKTGKITELDFYVLKYICRLIRRWIDEGIKPIPISFNLSRVHFFSATIIDDIISIVKGYGVPAEYIEVEVTESVFFEEANVIIEKVEKLREFGFKVSVDDFGAGYSSLNLIGILPVDIIKLDRGFVKDSLKTKRGNDVIKGLIKILNEINLDIVCEGVETKEEEKIINEYGCKDIQGFLYDRPIPVPDFEAKYIRT